LAKSKSSPSSSSSIHPASQSKDRRPGIPPTGTTHPSSFAACYGRWVVVPQTDQLLGLLPPSSFPFPPHLLPPLVGEGGQGKEASQESSFTYFFQLQSTKSFEALQHIHTL